MLKHGCVFKQVLLIIVFIDGGEEEGHLQLITHALAGAQSTGSKEDSHIQVITQEVSNMEELGVEGADNIQVNSSYIEYILCIYMSLGLKM